MPVTLYPTPRDVFSPQTTPVAGFDYNGGALYLVDPAGSIAVLAFGASGAADAYFVHEASGVLSLRHGSNAQELRTYGRHDFSVAVVYERMFQRFEGGKFKVGTEFATNAGSPGQPYSSKPYCISLDSVDRYEFDSIKGFIPSFTNVFPLGGTANRFTVAYANGVQGGWTKTLTESSATPFVTIAVPNSTPVSGTVRYIAWAKDSTNTQAKRGIVHFSTVANSSGTLTTAALSETNALNPCSSGTFTCSVTKTDGTNLLTLNADAASSLTQTTLEMWYRVELDGYDQTVTAL